MQNLQLSQKDAAKALLDRRQARAQFKHWCSLLGYQLKRHHEFIVEKLQEVADSEVPRYVIILISPGTAKSTYASKLFPPWFLGRRPGFSILACSHAKDLAQTFGRAGRNFVERYTEVLGYGLADDTRAADEWETSTGGRYFCAGVGAGIAGHRADLGLIDDYLGSAEDADSKTIRDQQWRWFLEDFYPRISGTKGENDGSIVIIANRRHEDDLVGRLLSKDDNDSPIDPNKWEVIKLPFFAEEHDPLGRQVGEVIWPEKFAKKAEQVLRLPSRVRAGLYQQSPRPDDGNYFKLSWLQGYEKQDLPENLRIYAASDHACSDGDGDSTVLLFGGFDGKNLWILPSCYWEKADTGTVVENMLKFGDKHEPLTWWAEKGHISKSIGPFLRDRMQDTGIYLHIEEIVPKHNKRIRARSAQGMCEFGQVYFPKFASWWDKAENELLTFDGGKNDDWVDAFAHLCAGIARMVKPERVQLVEEEKPNTRFGGLTLKDLNRRSRQGVLAAALRDK